jgi:hypothetical protein
VGVHNAVRSELEATRRRLLDTQRALFSVVMASGGSVAAPMVSPVDGQNMTIWREGDTVVVRVENS